jgi:two-component system LytT family response regulator/two-component system response regulator LytT
MDLNVLVVDDERLARDELVFLLQQIPGVEILAQAGHGQEALKLVDELDPDLVLLDVQMPGLSGFEVARRLVQAASRAEIIFVTAFDRHAIEAFEVNAVDYLLKPIDTARLEQAIERARRRVAATREPAAAGTGTRDLERLFQMIAERQSRRDRFAVKVGDRFLLVQADEIIHASLVDETITVVTSTVAGTSNYRTLDELQARLDPDVFWRVHRSHLVNINKIKEIVPWFSRNYILRMKDAKATEIPVSRSQTKRLREYLRL